MHAAVETEAPGKEAERGCDYFNCDPSLAKLEGAGGSWRENIHFTSYSMPRSWCCAQSLLGKKGQCCLAIRESQSQLSPWLGPILES